MKNGEFGIKGILLPWKPKLCEKFVNFDKNVFVGGYSTF